MSATHSLGRARPSDAAGRRPRPAPRDRAQGRRRGEERVGPAVLARRRLPVAGHGQGGQSAFRERAVARSSSRTPRRSKAIATARANLAREGSEARRARLRNERPRRSEEKRPGRRRRGEAKTSSTWRGSETPTCAPLQRWRRPHSSSRKIRRGIPRVRSVTEISRTAYDYDDKSDYGEKQTGLGQQTN